MTDVIAWLDEIDKYDMPHVGGKGANLGELFRAGFPVPRAFCVTTSAYQSQLEGAAIGQTLTGLLTSDATDLDRWSESIQASFLAAPILAPIEGAIRTAYRALGNTIPVAVRSSATAEDLPGASFAGQMETFLGVCGEQNLLEAIRKCWASLWSARAMHYRNEQGIAHASVALAVVVQEMVRADVAGVMFTVDPLTGVSTNMKIAASYGLGEALVAGQVTPDTYTITKEGLSIFQRIVGQNEIKVIQQGNGTAVVPVSDMERRRPCLSDSQILEIARIGLKVERHYAQAQDIEWAVAGDRIYILQARPVTALPKTVPPPILEVPGRTDNIYGWIYLGRIPRPMRGVFPTFARDHFPHPLRPFDIYNSLAAALAGVRRVAADIGIEMPSDVVLTHKSGLVLFNPPVPSVMRTLRRFPTVWRRLKILIQYDPLREWQEIDESQVRALIPPTLCEDISASEILQSIRQLNGAITELMYRRFRKYMAPGAAANRRLSALLAKVAGKQTNEMKQKLMLNLNHKTAQCNRAIKALARNAMSNPAVREILTSNAFQGMYTAISANPQCMEFSEHLSYFLDEYGFRTAMTMEPQPSYPAWRDEPDQMLGLVGSMLHDPNILSDSEQEEQETYLEARAEIAQRLQDRPKQSAAFEWAVDTARGFVIAREASLYLLEEIVGRMREFANHLANHLVAEGKLRSNRQIYYLSPDDLDALVAGERVDEVGSIAKQRQAVWERMCETWNLPAMNRNDSRGHLRGAAVSQGVAIGPVKIVRGAHEFRKLKQGDILVCSSTTPAWTPLFSIAAGVVADVGGVLSHAAIVAREYGIPAVMGCKNATSAFVDGERIEVNGTTGTVRRISPSSDESVPLRT